MSETVYEIRLCLNPECGLRYPLTGDHRFGERCPACLGETKPVLARPLSQEHSLKTLERRLNASVLLDNIRSAGNTGSILRSAEGAGFAHAFLCGVTPAPGQPGVRKTALGAQESLSWSSHRNGAVLVRRLAGEGFYLLALETGPAAVPLRRLDLDGIPPESLVLVVGSEVAGIDPGILEYARQVTCIPMRGAKVSLNAAVAFGIAAYEISEKLAGRKS